MSTKHGRIAFMTTPQFRTSSPEALASFIYRHFYSLCNWFHVVVTGRTWTAIMKLVNSAPNRAHRVLIEQDLGISGLDPPALRRWRTTIKAGVERTVGSFQGMIYIAYELVEGRLDGVVHFTDWQDKSAKPDSAVLSREANVHNVPIATDPDTAKAYVLGWGAKIAAGKRPFAIRKKAENPPLTGLKKGHRVLAMVAHDKMKLHMCQFAVANASKIFDSYSCILSTGNTGTWIRSFMAAVGRSADDINKIRLCKSGPDGGDLQIAYAVVQEICEDVIFLQDPTVSHPHDSDIRLFEQAVVSPNVHVRLATNLESALLLIEAAEDGPRDQN